MRNAQRAIPLVLLVALGLTALPVVAGSGSPQWKDTGPVTKKKQNEVNSGSWQPQPQPTDEQDPENPLNEGEASDTYDDGDT
ncbi:hypothetical protein IFR35_22115 [Pseudomonas fluorescens]|uniref:hypothetical protein n=1 Tax=Pseudomonas TaxID=286 RepID=UPI000DD3D350|nr:hypothetical protein [Pseudomonas sp. LG1E9]MBD8194100.1 hypothetical protein [Pseudomonas fluorescens]MBD8229091.1 hypothetical protein [Pseudomonas fluorescens]MBD8786910.1 hypothetical protein [Pseudomonas fluorescens]MBD8819256.1 hypothetical protein [Pseudomonas fluorescens]